MKVLIHAVAALAILAMQGCSVAPKEEKTNIAFNKDTPLYRLTSTSYQAFTIDAYEKGLPDWLVGAPRAVLFVHGRGNEPTKSILGQGGIAEGRALLRLTERNLRPVMFNWNSAADGLDRHAPLSHVGEAAESFAKLLKAHADLRARQPAMPRPVLLVHSMGALVIQQVVERDLWPKEGQLFERIVFSEPDADRGGHELWMSKLASTESVWVTWNRGDIVLNSAFDARKVSERALGLGVPKGQPLAKGVHYLNLSFVGTGWQHWLNHTIFVASSFGQQPEVDDFIGRLLAGDPIEPKTDRAVQRVDERGVIRLRTSQGPQPAEASED